MTDKCKQQQCANPSWCKLTGKCLVEKFPQTTGLAPDCRTCSLFYDWEEGVCAQSSRNPCTNADKYEPLPPVKLWRTAP